MSTMRPLLRLATVFHISDDDFARAFIHARETYAAANPDFDEFVQEVETIWQASATAAKSGLGDEIEPTK
jgi:hypothetical protein